MQPSCSPQATHPPNTRRHPRSLLASALIRKVNEVVKRARAARVHAVIITHLKAQLPSYFGRAAAMQKVSSEYRLIFKPPFGKMGEIVSLLPVAAAPTGPRRKRIKQ